MNQPESTSYRPYEQGIREQIEILWRYQSINEQLDPTFIRNHARSIVQLSEEMSLAQRPRL